MKEGNLVFDINILISFLFMMLITYYYSLKKLSTIILVLKFRCKYS